MRTLFVYPEFPKTFWSYEKILELVNRKVLLPPLGMVTVAALLPQEWEMKLVDRNVREVTDEEWNWAELVIISGMIVQKYDMAVQISKAKQRVLPVAVGGPQRALPRIPLDRSAGNPRTAGISASRRTHSSQRTAAGLILSPAHRPFRHAGTAQPSATPAPNKGHGRGD